MKQISKLCLDYPYLALSDIEEQSIEEQIEMHYTLWDNITD